MKRNHFFLVRFSAILILVFNLVACGSIKNGNFNRQKFTKLKKIEANVDPQADADIEDNYQVDNSFAEDETSSEQSGVTDKVNTGFEMDDEISTEKAVQLQPETDVNKGMNKTEIKDPLRVVREDDVPPGKKDFKTFTQEKKNQAIIQFNALFNAGLAILIIATLLLIIAGILTLGPSNFIITLFGVIGAIMIFVSWIISLIALNKVRRIRKADFVGNLGIKVNLARLVAFIGIAVCVITILGGVILGILWLARLI